jgi:hypothetical protein
LQRCGSPKPESLRKKRAALVGQKASAVAGVEYVVKTADNDGSELLIFVRSGRRDG